MAFRFTMTGNAKIKIKGNIENLLDYQTVTNGGHPTMTPGCFASLFNGSGCDKIIEAPELPATTLISHCYGGMFANCSSLIEPPKLPATTLDSNCYNGMFQNCTNLTTLPKLPATTLPYGCYMSMFSMCSKIKVSATQTGSYQYEFRMPTSGTGTIVSGTQGQFSDMFSNTGGTFTGTPAINTTYYTDHEPI